MGNALAGKGILGGAIAEYHTALRLKPDYAEVHNNLGSALSNKEDAGELVEFARLCLYEQQNAAAVRLYAEAFTERPELAGDVNPQHRYNAAYAAALAAAGEGEDAASLESTDAVASVSRRLIGCAPTSSYGMTYSTETRPILARIPSARFSTGSAIRTWRACAMWRAA